MEKERLIWPTAEILIREKLNWPSAYTEKERLIGLQVRS
jgi:hypothetical protein